ncbi:ankyrin repeat and SOCS box protein 12 [Protopterus annectens]|uniref:ankyrin repeat and SOCS box protein 12 n=1 Tax=Protopterus annectens TaxID=7888 RepID=UPI001CF98558|nr:ankyrin repeat and SOCS box protein 12 [Protopterus annectens]XP_043913505.1 ankyrin repeat and SOCS box protein 12 [Protopterus annectens]
MILKDQTTMSLVDVTKMFSMLQAKEEEQGNEESQLLFQAVSNDDHKLLAELLSQEKYKKFINRRSGWGIPGTPLRLAACEGHLKCLEVLLSFGAEVDSLDVKAQTPLFIAVRGGHLECVQALLAAGADPNGSIHNGCSPLLNAARQGNVEIIKELLNHDAEINVRQKLAGWARNPAICSGPLYLSAIYRQLECFKILLVYGADPDYNCIDEEVLARLNHPKTVLDSCLKHGCGTEYIKLLIDFGANVYLPTFVVDHTVKCEAMDLVNHERAHPKMLMSQCRLVIRKSLLQAKELQSIDRLDIPAILKDYLKHETVVQISAV